MDDKKPSMKPCPFCGWPSTVITGDDHGSRFVMCIDCGASGPECNSDRDAVRAWNKRQEEEAKERGGE